MSLFCTLALFSFSIALADGNAIVVPEEGLSVDTKELESLPRHDLIEKVLILATSIEKRVQELGEQIAKDYKGQEVTLLAILKGAFVFAADLGRAIVKAGHSRLDCEFMKTVTYEEGVCSLDDTLNEVKISLKPRRLKGRHVLIVEDMLDRGVTLTKVKDYLLNDVEIASLKTCVLLKKELENPSDVITKLREQIAPEYIGFTIPEVWVAGYGLDATREDMRFLQHVVSIRI